MKNIDKIQIDLDTLQMALLREFHREILTRDMLQVIPALQEILEREVPYIEARAIQSLCRKFAEEWGSPDLAGLSKEDGVTERNFTILEGGKE